MDVKQCRDRLGMSQRELARRIGVNNSTVSDWEVGKTKPSEKNADKIEGLMICKNGTMITPKMSKKYGCRWCADRRGGICPHEKCAYADILDKYESYNDYQKQVTGDNLLRGIRL